MSSIASCNAEVIKVLKAKQSRSVTYMKLTPVQRYEIGNKEAEMGVTAAIRYYKKKFPDVSLTEPTMRRLKILYLEELAKKPLDTDSSEFNELPYNNELSEPCCDLVLLTHDSYPATALIANH